jgi:hypothetical protein
VIAQLQHLQRNCQSRAESSELPRSANTPPSLFPFGLVCVG